jgi:nicotinate-nucleotide pyrophosphorylase
MISKNIDTQTFQRIRPQIDHHNSLYEDVQPGDRYSLTYIPGRGTELALNGKIKGIIKGADFASALFSMWLGKFPMNEPFKKQLLRLK